MTTIAENIRELRMSRDMTQDQLAEKLFVTRQTVSNYETGKSQPDIDMLVKIRDVLQVDIDEIIHEKVKRKTRISKFEILSIAVLWILYWILLITYTKTNFLLGHKMWQYAVSFIWTANMIVKPFALIYTAYIMCKLIPQKYVRKNGITNAVWWVVLIFAFMQLSDAVGPIINSIIIANGITKAMASGLQEYGSDMFSIVWLQNFTFSNLFAKLGVQNFNIAHNPVVFYYKLEIPIFIVIGRILSVLKPDFKHKNRVDK